MAEERTRPRYRVRYPVEVGHSPGSSDDLEEAGRIYLTTLGATDIWDEQERRWINPEAEIDCVAAAYQAWHEQRETVS